MNDKTLLRVVLVLCLLMLAINGLTLKELKTTVAAEDPVLPPANTLFDSGCNKICNRLQRSYTFAEPTFDEIMNVNGCYRTCYSKSIEWQGKCLGSVTSPKDKSACRYFSEILQRTA